MRESRSTPREVLVHPAHGPLPARRVLDCVFALLPEGRILHRHIDDLGFGARTGADGTDADDTICYVLGDLPPSPAHARCRVIPPRVREF